MIPYSRKVAMPKRKAKTAGECPPPKYPKLEQGGSKHGRRNGLTTRPVKSISSNWKALSKSMGVSSRRKQDWSISDQVADGKLKEGRRKIGKHAKEKGPDVWFDDVPLDCVNGELVARAPKKESASSLITGLDKSTGRYVALDCEMVGTGPDGSYSMLARVCVVNHHGYTIYDTFVAPMDKITDYRTAISGVTPKDLHGAPEFSVAQKQVSDLLKGRILVGHSLQNDMKALLLSHPQRDTRDTSKYRVFKSIAKTRYPSLKKLAKEILGIDIQTKEHNPVEDARVAMKLYQLHKKEWEASVRARLTKREIRERKREKRRKEEDVKKRGFQKWTSCNIEPAVAKPFNIMLHTDR